MKQVFMTNKELYLIQRALREQFARSEWYKYNRDRHLSKNTGKRGGQLFICSVCKNEFPAKDFQLHHEPEIIRIGEHYYEVSISEFVERLWAEENQLIGVCKCCHDDISAKQNEERRQHG